MILRSINGNNDNAKTPTKLNTDGVGLKSDNVTSDDVTPNTELGV